MPDGEMEFCDRVRNSMQYEILMMLKRSCESAMHNHLLLRDLRVGKFCDAADGVEAIRNVYRALQERIKSGEEVCMGRSTEDFTLYLQTPVGTNIRSAESILSECKLLDESADTWNGDGMHVKREAKDDDEGIIVIKGVDSGSSVQSSPSSIDISIYRDLRTRSESEEEDFTAIDNILSDIKIMSVFESMKDSIISQE